MPCSFYVRLLTELSETDTQEEEEEEVRNSGGGGDGFSAIILRGQNGKIQSDCCEASSMDDDGKGKIPNWGWARVPRVHTQRKREEKRERAKLLK